MLHLIIHGRPIAKKNNPQAYCISGCKGWYRGGGSQPRKIIIPSKEFLEYEKHALKQLMQWGNHQFTESVNVCARYWMDSGRSRPDLLGLEQATADILEKSQIIVNDRQIRSWDGSKIMGVDRDRPRAEIEIRECES